MVEKLTIAVVVIGVLALAGCGSQLSSERNAITSTTAPVSGVYGYVTAGPTCPVERPDRPCPPQPVATHVEAINATGVSVSATSDTGGLYRLILPAGTYTLTANNGSPFPRCPPTPVTLTAGQSRRMDIDCDTGIR